MFRKSFFVLVLFAVLLSACGGAAPAQEDPTLKIAVLPILDALPMYVAEAQGYFNRAVALKPDYANAYYNLGLSLFNQGQLEAAVSPLQQAVTLNPKLAEANYQLGVALLNLGRAAEAADCSWLLSEDFQAGRQFGSVTIVSPFVIGPDALR